MNCTFQVIGLLRSCLVSLILMQFVLTKCLTQVFVIYLLFIYLISLKHLQIIITPKFLLHITIEFGGK